MKYHLPVWAVVLLIVIAVAAGFLGILGVYRPGGGRPY